MSKKKFAAIGKTLRKEYVNNNILQIVEGVNSLFNDNENVKVLQAFYPNGNKWYEKILKKNQDVNKVFENEKKFLKNY